jgi:hypothetical protein
MMELNLKDRLKIFFGIIFNTFQKTIELIYHTTTVTSSPVSSKTHSTKNETSY